MKALIIAPIAIFVSVAIAGTPDNPENMTPCLVCIHNEEYQRGILNHQRLTHGWMNG